MSERCSFSTFAARRVDGMDLSRREQQTFIQKCVYVCRSRLHNQYWSDFIEKLIPGSRSLLYILGNRYAFWARCPIALAALNASVRYLDECVSQCTADYTMDHRRVHESCVDIGRLRSRATQPRIGADATNAWIQKCETIPIDIQLLTAG